MPFLLVPSHHDVAQDVFREADRSLELPRLLWRQRELEDAIVAVTVVVDLVGETPARRGRDLFDLAAKRGDRRLETFAHGREALLVGRGGHEIHELVRSHRLVPFHGFAAGSEPGAKRRRGTGPRRSLSVYGN